MTTFKAPGSVAAEICRGAEETTKKLMCRVIAGSVVLLAATMTLAGTAMASTVRLCVPKNEGSAVLTAKHGKCKNGYARTTLGQQGKEGKQGPKAKGEQKAKRAQKASQARKAGKGRKVRPARWA